MGGSHSVNPDGSEKEKARIEPDSEALSVDLSSRIELSLRLEDLQKPGHIFVVIYSKWAHDPNWVEIGKTKVKDDQSSHRVFDDSFPVDFKAESQRQLRFETYRLRDSDCIQDLSAQKFIGTVEVFLTEIMMARSRTVSHGWLVKSLQNPLQRPGEPDPGKLCMFAEEDPNAKSTVAFVVGGKQIKSTDFFKRRADAYCIINRTTTFREDEEAEEELECTPVYRSEVCRRSANPKWKRSEFGAATLSANSNDREIVIEVWDWFRVSRAKYIGEAVVTLADLQKCFRDSRPMVRPICVRDGKRTGFLGSTRSASKRRSKSGSKTSRAASNGRSANHGSLSPTGRSGTGKSTSKSRGGTKDSHRSAGSRRISDLSAVSGLSASPRSSVSVGQKSASSGGSSGTWGTAAKGPIIFGKHVGDLVIDKVEVMRSYTFLDYLRGGLELKLGMAIDFTRSNRGPSLKESRHHVDPTGVESSYATAIRAIGSVMKSYDQDDRYPVYGFGAQIPPTQTIVSDCFALTGDFWDPEVDGIDGILRAYKRALQVVRLHGPSHLDKVIKLFADMARPYADAITPPVNGVEMKYFVLVIVTDGEVHQQQKITDEIIGALDLPLSIVIVGVGDGTHDFAYLRTLANDINSLRKTHEAKGLNKAEEEKRKQLEQMMQMAEEQMEKAKADKIGGGFRNAAKQKKTAGPQPAAPLRDIVHFVNYSDYHDKPYELAAAALSELPREVVGYFQRRNVKPRNLDKFEDEMGQPVPKFVPTGNTKTGAKSAPGTKSAAASRSSTKNSEGGQSVGAMSRASSTLATPEQKAEKDLKKRLESLPPFLKAERQRLQKEAEKLGYTAHQINRAFRDGVPAATVEVLVDNIVNGGYGKSPTYKDAAEAAIEEPLGMQLSKLPGQIEATPQRRTSTADSFATLDVFDFRTLSAATLVASTLSSFNGPSPMPNLELVEISSNAGERQDYHSDEGGSSAGSSKRGTKEAMTDLPSYTFDGAAVEGGSMSALKSLSKSILKSKSREVSKEVERSRRWSVSSKESNGSGVHFEDERPTNGRNFYGTKDSIGSQKSLRSSASVRFSDEAFAPEGEAVCRICMEAPVQTTYSPCGHSLCCSKCADREEKAGFCELCKAPIVEVLR